MNCVTFQGDHWFAKGYCFANVTKIYFWNNSRNQIVYKSYVEMWCKFMHMWRHITQQNVNHVRHSVHVSSKFMKILYLFFSRNCQCGLYSVLTMLILLIMALQLFMQSFGLLNQFLPSSSILDKGLPIWHFWLDFRWLGQIFSLKLFFQILLVC